MVRVRQIAILSCQRHVSLVILAGVCGAAIASAEPGPGSVEVAVCQTICSALDTTGALGQLRCQAEESPGVGCRLNLVLAGYPRGSYCMDSKEVGTANSVTSLLQRSFTASLRPLRGAVVRVELDAEGVSEAGEHRQVATERRCHLLYTGYIVRTRIPELAGTPRMSRIAEPQEYLGFLRALSLAEFVEDMLRTNGMSGGLSSLSIRGRSEALRTGPDQRRVQVAMVITLSRPAATTARVLRQISVYPGVAAQLVPFLSERLYSLSPMAELSLGLEPRRLREWLGCGVEIASSLFGNRRPVLFNGIEQEQILGAVSLGARLVWPRRLRALTLSPLLELRGTLIVREIRRTDLPISTPERQVGMAALLAGGVSTAVDLTRSRRDGGGLKLVAIARLGWMPIWIDEGLAHGAAIEAGVGIAHSFAGAP